MATTGYQAGVESNAVIISYGAETVWGTLPAVAFQAIRMTSESLSDTKTRNRPAELNSTGEVTQAVTTQETAAGGINYSLSFGTYDDFWASTLSSAWGTAISLVGSSADCTITTATNVLSSTTANKFQNIVAGQFILLSGFTNAVNNGVFRVITKTDSTHLIITPPYLANGTVTAFVTETPAGAAFKCVGGIIQNGTTEQTLYVQKQLSSTLYLNYPGTYVSGFTVSGSTGQFLSGTLTLMSKQELQATTNSSTGAVTAANTRKVMDPVSSFEGVLLNNVPIGGTLNSFALTVTNTGAAMEYGMGSSLAAGFIAGLLQVTGTLEIYFNNFTLYNLFKAETLGVISIKCGDTVGNTYVFTILACTLMNPKIVAGNQNTAVMAQFDIEGNPQTGGGTLQIDRLLVA